MATMLMEKIHNVRMALVPGLFLCFLLLRPAIPCAAASPPLVLGNTTDSAPLSGHIDVLEDKSGKLTIEEARSPAMAARFRADNRKVLNFGVTSSVYWLRFSISNESAAAKRWLLDLDFPHMDYLDLYLPGAGGDIERMQAGDMRPMSIRKLRNRNPVFPLDITTVPETFYLRIDPGGRVIIPLTVWSPEAFSRKEQRSGLSDGCFFGAMLVMLVYNFFVFLSLRDRNYLYYILDIFFLTLYLAVIRGYLIDFVSGEMPLVSSYSAVLVAPGILAGSLFCRNFLQTGRNVPTIDRVIKFWMCVALLSIPAIFVVSPEGWKRAMTLVAPCASITAMVAGVVCFQRGFRPARY